MQRTQDYKTNVSNQKIHSLFGKKLCDRLSDIILEMFTKASLVTYDTNNILAPELKISVKIIYTNVTRVNE